MRKWMIALIGMTLFVLGACGSDTTEEATTDNETEEAVETVDTEAMEELLKESCISCHSGDFALSEGGTDLPVDEIRDIIVDGVGDMPPTPTDEVSEEEALELAEYLAKE